MQMTKKKIEEYLTSVFLDSKDLKKVILELQVIQKNYPEQGQAQ